ncbi:hypothetical protein BpHYR1_027244 [Brachionus plicatilis]|uniref:Uncharacterized protein n=1 Tax=Brachionus plicatilis TaxID=10195 RepID=A0A3M7SN69_BRAPC|nr:hypothetical protein BpHYR1_027244 [Brachionus plicatilis]
MYFLIASAAPPPLPDFLSALIKFWSFSFSINRFLMIGSSWSRGVGSSFAAAVTSLIFLKQSIIRFTKP